ncbi:zinc-binding dehydrogenase [Castellaniella denitrificans]|jgi:alcohol dehydrogenase|uniref:zinc-binding dehydrogenase n=1 Tax=Castellaniella denitrificans TaxID=56119 RepID=UPI001AD1132E|nr:alcohol dehydrogenase catalytic domain-containing protein [Burkholderiales bacterium]
MKMTAAVMYEQGRPKPYVDSLPFQIEDVELEGPGEGEVLVEVVAAGLCHSDLSQVAGLRKRKLPVVGGHEGAGIVREVGAGVTELKPGDHVVMTVVSGCGCCRACNRQRPALCQSVTVPRTQGLLATGVSRLSRNGQPIYHYSGVSAFAQYAITVPKSLIRIDDDVPLDVAAMFGCAVVTGAGAVLNTAQVPAGASVAVIGLGGVGLNAVMAARIAGASQIFGIDINAGKFPLARDLGATETVLASDPDIVQKIRDLSKGGVDFTFDMTGNPQAVAMGNAITARGGDVICVGLGASDTLFQYVHAALVTEERGLRGSFMGSTVPERDIPHYISLYKAGKMPVDRLKSSEISFAELNLSLDQLDRGEVVRQILMPHAA